MTIRPRFLVFLLLVAVLLGRSVRAEDEPPESPEDRARRLKLVASRVTDRLGDLHSDDVVVRGNALEAIAEIGNELKDLEIPEFADRVRRAGLTAPDRFLAVQAGEILNVIDPEGTVEWLERAAFSGATEPRRRRNALAMISEIPLEESGKIAAVHARNGPTRSRVEALVALGKLRLPGTYKAALSALGAQEQAVKDNAALALGKIGDARAIPALLSHLEDSAGDHPAFAAWALKQFDDPAIVNHVVGRLGNDGGHVGNAKAQVLEACAREEHVGQLRRVLTQSRSEKFRSAAAVALGRLSAADVETQELLLKGLLKERNARVMAACFFALSRNASESLRDAVVKGLRAHRGARRDDDLFRLRALAFLAGDLNATAAAPTLLRLAKVHPSELTWRVAAVNFWRCADRRSIRRLKEEFSAAAQEPVVARLAEIFGRSRREQEFLYLCNQLRAYPARSANGFAVELALEHMTGHFFGPEYRTWRVWFEKNPHFFEPREYRIDRRKWRKEFSQKDREFRQTPETERAVQLGLAWLSRHISTQGALNPNKFFEQCDRKPTCKKTGARQMLDLVGCSALGALAFLGGGYSPDEGKYKDAVRRLLEYVEVRQTADGNYDTTDRFQGYQRPIAIYALAEAYNITGDERYAPYLRRGIDYLTEIQNERGGWHYQAASTDTDTSVMSWVLLGLGVAHKSGFPVREAVFEGCDMILDLYSERVVNEREQFRDVDPHYGYEVGTGFQGEYQTGYRSRVSENATTAFGLLARMFLGWRRSHPFCIGSARFILKNKQESLPRGENWARYVSKNRFPSYAWYYGTLAMHQMGGRYFREWNAVIRKLLPGLQIKDGCDSGAWEVMNYDFVGGKVYTTCMGVLTLETYYRYKPFCEEGMPPEEEEEDEGK